MRLLVYNICYGVGVANAKNFPVHGARFVVGNRKNLEQTAQFIEQTQPDLVGLLEVDTGSMRNRRLNQVQYLADRLGHYSAYASKYDQRSLNQYLPIVRKQSNAFLAEEKIHGERFHYFNHGIKRLAIELEMENYAIFLVHLSLKFKHRQLQLKHLYQLILKTDKPVIVAGDMNTFEGHDELVLFMKAAGLRSANTQNQPTFPSWNPRHELDFILYQDGITVENFSVPDAQLSDHLPLVCDFTVQ